MSAAGLTLIEKQSAREACRYLSCVFSETRSNTVREACKSAIVALCDEYQIVQFGLLPDDCYRGGAEAAAQVDGLCANM